VRRRRLRTNHDDTTTMTTTAATAIRIHTQASMVIPPSFLYTRAYPSHAFEETAGTRCVCDREHRGTSPSSTSHADSAFNRGVGVTMAASMQILIAVAAIVVIAAIAF